MATEIKDLLIRIRADSAAALKAMDDVAKRTDNLAKNANNVGKQMSATSIAFAASLGSMAGHAAWGALKSAFNSTISTGMRFNAMIEENTVAMTAMLGSADKAKDLLKTIWDIASKTPFEYERLVGVTKQLIAMGFEASKLPSMLWTISDAVAALGGGAEKAERMALSLGQINTIGHATGRELRELQMAGLNAIEAISLYIGKSQTEVTEMVSKGSIDAKTFMAALQEYVADKWGGMAQKVSTTYNGMISTLKDLTSQLMGSLMTGPFELLKGYFEQALKKIEEVTTMIMANKDKIKDWFNELFKAVSIVAKSVGDVLLPVLKSAAIAIYEVITAITKFVNDNPKLIDFIVKFGAALLAGNMALKTTNNLMNIASGAMSLFSKATFASIGSAAKLTTVLGGAATAAGLVAGAATAAGVALYYMNKYSGQVGFTLYKQEEDIRNAINMLKDLGLTAAEVDDVLKHYAITLPQAGKSMKYNTEKLKEWAEALGYLKKEGDISDLTDTILNSAEKVTKGITNLLSSTTEGTNKAVEEALKKLEEYYKKVAEIHAKNIDEIYNLSHSKRAIETRELEKWRNEQLAIVGNNAKMQLEIWTLFNMKVKALREQWAEEDKDNAQKMAEEALRIQEEKNQKWLENEKTYWDEVLRIREEAEKKAQATKSVQDKIDELTMSEEDLWWKKLNEEAQEMLKAGVDQAKVDEYLQAAYNDRLNKLKEAKKESYSSLTQMYKDLEEFIKVFNLDNFKAMVAKVTEIATQAINFMQNIKVEVSQEALDNIKKLNETFKDVLLSNFTNSITSINDLMKTVNAGMQETVDINKIKRFFYNFLLMFDAIAETAPFVTETIAVKSLEAIKILNEFFKDVSVSEFSSTVKSMYELMILMDQRVTYNRDNVIKNIFQFLMDLEQISVQLQQLLGGENFAIVLKHIADESRAVFGYINEQFKDITMDKFLKFVSEIDQFIKRFSVDSPTMAEKDVANLASRFKFFLDAVYNLAQQLDYIFSNDSGLYLEHVAKKVGETFARMDAAFKDVKLTEFTRFLTELSAFEQGLIKDKNGHLMTKIDLAAVKAVLIKMLDDLKALGDALEAKMYATTGKNGVKMAWIDLLSKNLDDTVIKLGEIFKKLNDALTQINKSWETIVGQTENIKNTFLDTISQSITGLNELLSTPTWGAITTKLESTWKKVAEFMRGLRLEFQNTKVAVVQTVNEMSNELSMAFDRLIQTVTNKKTGMTEAFANLGKVITESDVVKKFTEFSDALLELEKGFNRFISKIETWIVQFTKLCVAIAYLATYAKDAIGALNLEIDQLLSKAGKIAGVVETIGEQIQALAEKGMGSLGEYLNEWNKTVDNLTNPGASEAAFFDRDAFPKRPPPWHDPSNPDNNSIVVNGNIVLQGVQDPVQLAEELKRLSNTRGGINVQYSY